MKNALQAQLLKSGLVDSKKAKKLNKQNQHAKRTGDSATDDVKKALAEANAKKLEKDQKLNQEKQKDIEEKTLKANVIQMIKQHQLTDIAGEIKYRFIDDTKIKNIYINQSLFDQVADGHVCIATLEDGYALLPRPLAERINLKMTGFIVVCNNKAEEVSDEDDPYADYVIPDDLMW